MIVPENEAPKVPSDAPPRPPLMVKETLVNPPEGTVHVRIWPTALKVMVQLFPEIDTDTPLVLSTDCAHTPVPTVAADARDTRWGKVPVPTNTTLAQITVKASQNGPRRAPRTRVPYTQYVSILLVWSVRPPRARFDNYPDSPAFPGARAAIKKAISPNHSSREGPASPRTEITFDPRAMALNATATAAGSIPGRRIPFS